MDKNRGIITIPENSLYDEDERKKAIGIIVKLLEKAESIGVSSNLSFRSETCDYTIYIYDAPVSLL